MVGTVVGSVLGMRKPDEGAQLPSGEAWLPIHDWTAPEPPSPIPSSDPIDPNILTLGSLWQNFSASSIDAGHFTDIQNAPYLVLSSPLLFTPRVFSFSLLTFNSTRLQSKWHPLSSWCVDHLLPMDHSASCIHCGLMCHHYEGQCFLCDSRH